MGALFHCCILTPQLIGTHFYVVNQSLEVEDFKRGGTYISLLY